MKDEAGNHEKKPSETFGTDFSYMFAHRDHFSAI
jgi:hypothetical protein